MEDSEPNPHLMVMSYLRQNIIAAVQFLETGVYVGIEEGESVEERLLEGETETVMVGV